MDDEKYIRRCFELALKGRGTVTPNPFVGCVIVHNGTIIGEGFHKKSGGPHAEVEAITSVENKELLKESTLYVNLEPCSHYGKTPPCSDLIISMGIPKVVCSNLDPHKEVAGNGFRRLRDNGVEVVEKILEQEGGQLNKRFFTYHRKRRPYIILKWAESLDGFMDINRNTGQKGIHWISQPETKAFSHRLRAWEDAILVGVNTIINDNPSLTTREFEGSNPLRIVVDPNNRLEDHYRVFKDGNPTLVYNFEVDENKETYSKLRLKREENILLQILDDLHKRQILSVIIEGGKKTIESFINAGLWDEAFVIVGQNELEDGLKAPILEGVSGEITKLHGDTIKQIFAKS